MKALRKQRLCSFHWNGGNGKIDLVLSKNGLGYLSQTVFSIFRFPRWKRMPPHSQFLTDLPSQGSSTYPRGRRNSLRRPPVNLRFSSDRASGLGKRQKGQLASSPCQSTAFTGPRQRSGKKTKGTACAVPPAYGVIIKLSELKLSRCNHDSWRSS